MVNFAENCGVFGIYSDKNCIHDLYYGIFKLQHRGQRYCGIATARKELKLITHNGFVRHTFTPQEVKDLSGRSGIGRTFKEALQKGIRSLEEIRDGLRVPNSDRLFYVRYAFRQGISAAAIPILFVIASLRKEAWQSRLSLAMTP